MTGDKRTRATRRRFLTLAGGAAAMTALAGCSKGGDTPSTTPNGGETSNTTQTKKTTEPKKTTQNVTETTTTTEQKSFSLTVTQSLPPFGLDPHAHIDTPTETATLQVYEGLLTQDGKGKIKPGLATKYQRLDSGNKVRFQIRSGVTFHNGDELTPDDIAYSVNRIVQKSVDINSPQRGLFNGVIGAKAKVGDEAVEVSSDGLNPVIFSEFANYGSVMQKKWTTAHSESYVDSNAMGTGPYRVSSISNDGTLTFDRFKDYWGDAAAVTTFTLEANSDASANVDRLLAGKTDVVTNVPPQGAQRINNSKQARVAAAPSTRIMYAAMRTDVEPFSNLQFRQGLNYAVDLSSIVKNVLGGFGSQTGQPVLSDFTGYNDSVTPYPYDKKKATTLIEQSGHAGSKIELHVPEGRYLKGVEIAQAVVGYIDELPNVSATLKKQSFASLVNQLLSGDPSKIPPLYLAGWNEPTFDGGLVMQTLLASDGLLSTWQNKKFDTLLKNAYDQNGKERTKTLEQASQLAHDQAPWIFLNQQYSVYGVRSSLNWDVPKTERINVHDIQKQ